MILLSETTSSVQQPFLTAAVLSRTQIFNFLDCAQVQGAANLLIGGSVSCLNRRIQDMPGLFSPGITEISSQLVPVIASESRLLLEDSEVQFWTFIPCNMPCIHLPAAC